MDFQQAELGPKMQACSDRERRFVWAYLLNRGKDASAAAREAGYSDPGPHSASIRVQAHVLLHRERVVAAIEEVARKAFRGLFLPAVAAVENLLDKPDHPDHLKAALSTLSRLGLGERSGVDVNVAGSVEVNHTDEALEQLRVLKGLGVPQEKLQEIFGFSGLARYERMLEVADARRPKLIEGEVVSRETP